MTRSDQAIAEAVLAELEWDARVGGASLGVEVEAGVVTVHRRVPT